MSKLQNKIEANDRTILQVLDSSFPRSSVVMHNRLIGRVKYEFPRGTVGTRKGNLIWLMI